jgi:uncharacterized protein (DUF952 family)
LPIGSQNGGIDRRNGLLTGSNSPTPRNRFSGGRNSVSNIVYKIVEQAAWRDAQRLGSFRGSPDDLRDGFIHLSYADQVEGTAARHFHNRTDLLLVAFPAVALGAALKHEASRGGALFPHLYADLPTTAALWEKPMDLGADGVPRATGDIG